MSGRPAEPSDLEAIARIDEKFTGQTRKDSGARALDLAALRLPWMVRPKTIEESQVCGTEKRPSDPILCRVCGESVLGDGWTP